MAEKNTEFNISAEKFRFVNDGERLHDRKFDDKPIGYFKDAWNRFRKNKASVVATILIVCIVLYAFVAPLLISHEASFMCATYAKKPARVASLAEYGILDGGTVSHPSEASFLKSVSLGVAAENYDGEHNITIGESMDSPYQAVNSITDIYQQELPGNKIGTYFETEIDQYLAVGFVYRSVEQSEYKNILAWQEENGIQVLYPLIEENEWNPDKTDANNWYKAQKKGGMPVTVNEKGKGVALTYSEDMLFEDNYQRDAEGNVVYFKFTGGGTVETAQYKIRVLYYNYYQYLYGTTPDYVLGTDSQGYDMALRLAGGIRLSLLVAVCVSVINFFIGACYGAVEGYYGGWVDMILERVSDILGNVPFIVVATLFQIHLSAKLGAVPCLLFAYVVTGWIGTAYRVRTQFYRFKNQEYVMAARTLGARDSRIIWKHIFPNTLGTLITSSALVIPSTILSESMLSFLGIVKLGTAESTSLGTLLADAQGIWTNYPHLMIYPAVVISLLMICFNLFGNGLRDAFNPALRGVED